MSPLSSQVNISEGVFESLVSILSEYLDDLREKLSQEFEIAMKRHRGDIDSACNAHVAEIKMLHEKLKATKEEYIVTEGRLTCRKTDRRPRRETTASRSTIHA